MSSSGARRTARGGPLTARTIGDDLGIFRCAAASLERGDDVAGTATHVRAILLVEHHGPWGSSVLRNTRLPDEVSAHLRTAHRNTKVLMMRPHDRSRRAPTLRVLLCFPARRLLLASTFTDPAELLDLDLEAIARGVPPEWTPLTGPFYGVCTHGRHDACCAERGRPVAKALTGIRPEETWEVSHMGGDRFAANLLVLPEGLYYGRTAPDDVERLVELHEQGRLDLDRLRGRAAYPNAAQYAEIALLRHLGDDRRDAVRLVARDGEVCDLRHGEDTWRVSVRRTLAEEAQLTCGAERLGPVPRFETVSIERI